MLSLASINVTMDPTWPWSLPVAGLAMLLVAAALLTGITIWTYHGVQNASRSRMLILVGLRLFALLLAFLTILRPSLAIQSPFKNPSTLLITLDQSQSMTIRDQHDGQARWEYAQKLLAECQPELDRLRDELHMSVRVSTFADKVSDYSPQTQATGPRTDFGSMLQTVYERNAGERFLRGLLVLSDGADNGSRYPALSVAARLRQLPCPLYTFAFGKTTTSSNLSDLALTQINPEPVPVAIKGKLTVKGLLDAPGFEKATVRVHLELNDKEVAAGDFKLTKAQGNPVELVCDAPAEAGEVKVALKVDPLPGEISQLNNEISTFVTVTKEGLSVLYVEGKFGSWEPKFIRNALSQVPNIRLFQSVRLSNEPGPAEDKDLFQFSKQHYDVVIIGDVSARRFSGGDPAVLDALHKLVYDQGAGLLMIGGYETFGNGDWSETPVAKMLPVRLDASDQIEGKVQMVPTPDGLRHFIMRLADREKDNAELWNRLPKLDGATRLGTPKPSAFVLAQTPRGEPLLVGQLAYGKGRTLAFGGDTTWRWARTVEGMRLQARFWQQMILWLAKKEESEGNLLVLPDSRRLAAGSRLGFRVKMRGKGGMEIAPENTQIEVSVRQPDGTEVKTQITDQEGELKGSYLKTDVPGEYELIARGSGKDTDGTPLQNLPPAKARIIIYQDTAELARQAADHAFLERLATAGGGKSFQADNFKQFLRDLGNQPLNPGATKPVLWPDWRKSPSSRTVGAQMSALLSSGILLCYALFVGCLCTEWLLRRLWGMV
jgi:uncharacterized membrane protein